MRTKILEAEGGGFYLKALLIRFTDEWAIPSALRQEVMGDRFSLLRQEGWGPQHFYIALLSRHTGGAMFELGNSPQTAQYDVAKAPAVT